MDFYTIKNLQVNSEIILTLNKSIKAKKIAVSCSNYYTIFCDDKVVSFGPNRTAKNHARIKEVYLPDFKELKIKIVYIGKPIAFDIEYQEFFIGIELLNDEQVSATLNDFLVKYNEQKLTSACRFSPQRAYIERYDFTLNTKELLQLSKMKNCPKILSKCEENCDYKEEQFTKFDSGNFVGFDSISERKYLQLERFSSNGNFNLDRDFFDVIKNDYKYSSYELLKNSTGLIKINFFNIKSEQKIFVVFNELVIDKKWKFGRSDCNEIIEITLKKGDNNFVASVPYSMKYLMILSKEKVDCKPSIILIQNDRILPLKDYHNGKINLVMESAKNTFQQNAFDIFTDCPSRERAGWLCDSYFLGIAEKFFTKKNNIEHDFLENFLLESCTDIPKKMLPMCYPSDHIDKTFLPNWAMWFVIELERYFNDSLDRCLIDKAKEKVYGLVEFFENYENKFGLLENLPSWVFVEWSKATSDEYIKCVSFSTNMLYYGMLKSISKLYNDKKIDIKANLLKQSINDLSFDGNYYCDNAIYVDNKLTPQRNHISETCQYYALFFNLIDDEKFKEKMINNFHLLQDESKQDIAKSAVFIGNFLRILWLLREKQYQKILDETVDYFYLMAEKTKTLWEKFTPDASCNHGFASCIAYVIDKCIKELKN